jgi:guanosine-3',5'-bis(diphosphate) 3'-pyrophosphohydrolase
MELFTRWHTFEQAEPGLRARLPGPDADLVAAAYRFAARWHGGQLRPTGAPYTEHLLEALEVLAEGAAVTRPDVLAAAVLHDVIEDTGCTRADIDAEFGGYVADLVGWVTIPRPGPGVTPAVAKEAYLRGLAAAPGDALLVKLADRASNVQTLRNLPLPRQRSYYAQTVAYIVPLAARVPWFARWYAQWQTEFADLAAPPAPGSR